MDYKKVLRLHFVNHLSCREIAESCGDCSKTTVNEFLKRFRENPELSYPLPADVTNEYIGNLLYKKPGVSADQLLYRDFNKEAVYKALARKGETLKHLWQKYNAIGVVDGKKPMSYRQYCRRYSEWADSKQLTFHIQRYPGVNLELDYAGKQLYLHNRRNPEETTKVTIFIAALAYSDYFYAEGMTECDIRNWIRVNNNALAYFGGVTPTVTPDNCKVAVARNKDWISPVLNKDFQAWAEHNNTVLTPAKVKSPRWKPVVEGHVKLVTMHILMDMEDMVFYSLDDLNRVLREKVAAENRKPFEGLSYSRYDLFTTEEKETLLPLPPNRFEYLERKTAKVAQDFSFTFDKVHYSMPRKYLRQELEIRAGEKEIYVYNKHGDLIRTHKRSYTPKDWVIIPSDMPAEYKDYGYWTVPYFQQKASAVGPSTRALIDAVIRKYAYPVQSFRSCFGILRYAEKYSPEALERCCKDAVLAGKCNYSYICNTISTYHKAPLQSPAPQSESNKNISASISGTYKDDDSKYSLRNLLKRQETEGGYEESETNDIYEMLDILALPVAAQRFAQLSESPELGSYTALQFIREVLEPQYIETLNKRFETNLRLSSLINKGAVAENLKTGNGRIYNDATVEQVLKFHFAENRQNVGIYGVTGAGKSYFLSACCVEACKRNYRCKFVDYSDLLDELIVLNRQEDLSKYRKRIRYYARIQLLFIDDFAISRYSEEGIKILYHLIKLRDDLGTSTLFTCQYSPDEWGNQLSDEKECYGKLDGIRRRLTTGFTVLIEKA